MNRKKTNTQPEQDIELTPRMEALINYHYGEIVNSLNVMASNMGDVTDKERKAALEYLVSKIAAHVLAKC